MKMDNLTMRELLKYARDNGYNSTMFYCKEKVFTGKFLDAYYEFLSLPLVGEDSFVTISTLEELYGYDLHFDIITDEEEYKIKTNISFVLRGKETPDKYTVA